MKDPTPRILSKVPTQQEIQFLEDRLYEHNATKINREDGKLFSKWIHDDSGNTVIAGLTGWIWANACEITSLWVREDHVKKGYGKTLLKAAEDEAKKRNCKTILLRTYSFQAPNFYLKFGYVIEYEIRNFPEGHSYLCLSRRLDELEAKEKAEHNF